MDPSKHFPVAFRRMDRGSICGTEVDLNETQHEILDSSVVRTVSGGDRTRLVPPMAIISHRARGGDLGGATGGVDGIPTEEAGVALFL